MVGTHFSYDENGDPLPPSNATPESEKNYYASQEKTEYTEPYNKKIIAWFDLSVENK